MFYGETELVDFAGQELDSLWAGSHRACLLFEAVLLSGGPEKSQELRKQLDSNLYMVATDLLYGKFPLVGYCLAQYISKSGLLSKATLLRKSSDDYECMNKEIAKTVLSRVWSTNLNLLTLHVIYWNYLILPPKKDADLLLEHLRQPPIWKALEIIPFHMKFIRNRDRVKLRLSELFGENSVKVDLLTERFRSMQKRLSRIGDDNNFPLWYRFLQMLKICTDLRTDKLDLNSEVLTKIKSWNLEMEEILSDCTEITKHLCLSRNDGTDGLTNFHDLIADHIHGVKSDEIWSKQS